MYESISGLTKNGLNLRYKPTAFGKKRKSIVKVWRPQLKKNKTKQKNKSVNRRVQTGRSRFFIGHLVFKSVNHVWKGVKLLTEPL